MNNLPSDIVKVGFVVLATVITLSNQQKMNRYDKPFYRRIDTSAEFEGRTPVSNDGASNSQPKKAVPAYYGYGLRPDFDNLEDQSNFDHRFAVRKIEKELLAGDLICDGVMRMLSKNERCNESRRACRHVICTYCSDKHRARMNSAERCPEFKPRNIYSCSPNE